MRYLQKIYLFIAVFLLSNSLSADNIIVSGEIQRLFPKENKVSFRLKNDNCITGNYYYYFYMNESDNSGKYAAKNWYAMLLSSAMALKPVSVSVDGCIADSNIAVRYIFQDY
jgi:hypothetical protein